ncbi:MAG: hypothetical protein OEY14_04855 [Myxococcales bacterium]|nr:hypothetical protein [Myxococcales bacterium]
MSSAGPKTIELRALHGLGIIAFGAAVTFGLRLACAPIEEDPEALRAEALSRYAGIYSLEAMLEGCDEPMREAPARLEAAAPFFAVAVARVPDEGVALIVSACADEAACASLLEAGPEGLPPLRPPASLRLGSGGLLEVALAEALAPTLEAPLALAIASTGIVRDAQPLELQVLDPGEAGCADVLLETSLEPTTLGLSLERRVRSPGPAPSCGVGAEQAPCRLRLVAELVPVDP